MKLINHRHDSISLVVRRELSGISQKNTKKVTINLGFRGGVTFEWWTLSAEKCVEIMEGLVELGDTC